MKLNLGSGTDFRQGEDWINLDYNSQYHPQVVHDLNVFPYPFESGQSDYGSPHDSAHPYSK